MHSKLYTEQFCAHMLLHRFFMHRAAFTHIRLYKQRLSHKEAFTLRNFYTPMHQDACAQRSIYAQAPLHTTLLHTEASTQRNLCTEQLLHKEVFLSPAPKTPKKANSFFPFLPFPFQITNAVMDDTEISRFLCLSFGFPFSILQDTMLDPFLQTDAVMHSRLYTEKLLSAHVLTQRGLCTEKLLYADGRSSSAEPAVLLFEHLSVIFASYLLCSPSQVIVTCICIYIIGVVVPPPWNI